jgi:hypothetical protein
VSLPLVVLVTVANVLSLVAVWVLLPIAGSGGRGINGSAEVQTATCSSSSSRGRLWRFITSSKLR